MKNLSEATTANITTPLSSISELSDAKETVTSQTSVPAESSGKLSGDKSCGSMQK